MRRTTTLLMNSSLPEGIRLPCRFSKELFQPTYILSLSFFHRVTCWFSWIGPQVSKDAIWIATCFFLTYRLEFSYLQYRYWRSVRSRWYSGLEFSFPYFWLMRLKLNCQMRSEHTPQVLVLLCFPWLPQIIGLLPFCSVGELSSRQTSELWSCSDDW